MPTRQRFVQETSLQDRIVEWAAGVRVEAAALPPGPDQDQLLNKVRQAETALHLDEWANSQGSQAPK
jgi:hypothetical protein